MVMPDDHYHEIGPDQMHAVMGALSDWFQSQGITMEDASEVCVHMLASILSYTVRTADDPEVRTERNVRHAVMVAQKELKFLALAYWNTKLDDK
jgi:hypothetical protein